MKTIKRLTAILTCVALLLSLLSANAFAANLNDNLVDAQQNTHVDEIEDGHVFTQKTSDKSVIIITDSAESDIAISIIYTSNPDVIYQWIFDNYSLDAFSPNSLDSWTAIIAHAENNLSEASLVEVTVEDVDENTPSTFSSAGADLAADLVNLVGNEYSNRFLTLKVMDGHNYRLFETMEYSIRKSKTLSWKSGVTIASILVSIVSVVATAGNVALLAGVLGIVGSVASTVLQEGKINRYSCMVLYTRYVTVDYGSTEYGHAYKIRHYDGYEDADLNSTGRAHVFPETEIVYYDPNQSEEYFNSGIFDEAYNAYNNIF